jgi:hypothetical protein
MPAATFRDDAMNKLFTWLVQGGNRRMHLGK